MSKKASPVLIGAFTLGTLALTLGTVLFFTAGRFFERPLDYLVFFDESVSGLEIGSNLKYRGVPVGKVKSIMLGAPGQRPESRQVPVLVSFDRTSLEQLGSKNIHLDFADPDTVHEAIKAGLRARLQFESIITGRIYIEVDFLKPNEAGEPIFGQTEPRLKPEIPSLPSPMASLGSNASEIFAQIGSIRFKELSENLNVVLKAFSGKIQDFDAAKVSGSIADAAASVKTRVESKEVTALLEQGRAALASADTAMASLNRELPRIMENIGPASEHFNKTLEDARKAIATFDLVGKRAAHILQEDSGFRTQLEGSLASLQRLGDSLQALAELIEKNPKSLLTGKKDSPAVPKEPKPKSESNQPPPEREGVPNKSIGF